MNKSHDIWKISAATNFTERSFMKKSRLLGAMCAFLVVLSTTSYATVIDTLSVAGNSLGCLGVHPDCGQTFGQTFTVPSLDTHLDDFGFAVLEVVNAPLNVQFKLYEWDGTDTTGPALFQSAVLSISNSSEQLYTFATDIDLVGGNQYMALLDTSSIGNSVAPFGRLTRIPNTTYLGGEFLWERTSGDGNWDDGFDVDVRFIARFSEPTVVLSPLRSGSSAPACWG